MIIDLEPPAERDLPPEKAARMRAALLRDVREPARRISRARLALAAAVVLAAAAGAVQLLPRDAADTGVTTVAMGRAELSPSLLATVENCVDDLRDDEQNERTLRTIAATGELAVAIERGGRAIAVFFAEDGYLTCDEVRSGSREGSHGYGYDRWGGQHDWLPGPVQRMSVASSELEHGWVFAAGRVSHRVHRLVLEHGTGNRTEARLANGAFGLVTVTEDVQPGAELVAYDPAGRVIEREPLFEPMSVPGRCYTDPSGKVIYSRVVEPDRDCLPAEPWNG
ncbi:hypothetical protein AB0F81_22905 [Actinoplanes sp. NPDC024001]|uniref:hypothetical protein n=1 Tax=Actinoplanes sp. NPDC024001 TaxID=3154598 RepID=UPI0033F08435